MASNRAVIRAARAEAPTVLVVDDEPDILDALQAVASVLFPEMGFAFTESVDEALRILKHQSIVLLITDFKMPGMNGNQLIAAARRQRPALPALIITAFSDPRTFDMKRAGSHGVEILSKPFEPLEFASVVRRLTAWRTT